MDQGLEIHDGAVTDLLLERRASGGQASVSGVLLASGAAGDPLDMRAGTSATAL